ncbi:protein NDRG1-like isoform X1 [Hypomesus transpacificus]|uniref:protein NDRG1-like isoform X1 n=1 Tax=Hypomesus transpacificus TaxID=137520 RepID=UPI001F07EE10|nr:protein NDRG1-like isoform X1 [Hypomesus transpacificus]
MQVPSLPEEDETDENAESHQCFTVIPLTSDCPSRYAIGEEDVETQCGLVRCSVKGVPKSARPAILTYHDIGLTYKSCFDPLFNHEDMHEISRHFAVVHVHAPGQHEGASTLSTGYTYPSVEQLSETLPQILKHFGLKSIIGLGMGAGAFILANFALNHPDMVEGLTLININAGAEGLIDSVTQKISGWTHTLPDTIISHLFGTEEIQNNHDLIATYRHHIQNQVNQANLQPFVRSYQSRLALEVQRPEIGSSINVRTLKCQTLLVVGDQSPAVEAVVECNSKLNPTKTTLLKMADCGGLPQVDQPASLTEAFKYFIQGMGYMSAASMTRLVRSRTASGSSLSSFEGNRSRAHTNEGRGKSALADPRGNSNTDASMEGISVTTSDHSAIKSTEMAC